MDKENYKNLIKNLTDNINSLKCSKEEKEEIVATINEITNEFIRFNNYINLNFDVYESEKKIILNHFIEKDDEVNKIYAEINKMKLELEAYKKTIFYKTYNILRKIYRKIFKRTRN